MKKKVVSLMMGTMLIASTLMGYGVSALADDGGTSSDPSSWPTVSFPIVPTVEVTDEAEVEAALNDYLVSIDAGVKADMVLIDFGNLNTVMTLMLSSSDEPIDIFSYQFFSNLSSVVLNDQVIPLDDYITQYPDVVEAVGADNMKIGKMNGTQYAIPVVGSYSTAWYYVLRKDIAEEIGVADKDETTLTLDEMGEIIKKAKEAHPELIYLPITDDLISAYNYDYLADTDWMGVLPDNGTDSTTIVDFYETDDFTDLCTRTKQYAENGFLLNDPLNQSHDKSYLKTGVAGGAMTNGFSFTTTKEDMTASYNFDSVIFQISDLAATSSMGAGGGYCISSVSQHPDEAMKLLSLMYTDENVMRFIAQGIEGKHYVVDENGCSWFPEGKSATDLGWGTGAQWYFPNQTLTIPFCTTNADYYKEMLEANKEATQSKAMGFVFDKSPVYDQYAAVDAVVQQYRSALLYGQVDVESYLEEFRTELKAAGIDEVIAEKQNQLDAFLAEN